MAALQRSTNLKSDLGLIRFHKTEHIYKDRFFIARVCIYPLFAFQFEYVSRKANEPLRDKTNAFDIAFSEDISGRASTQSDQSLHCPHEESYSPAEIQDDLAIASIENVFVYSDRYGHSDLKSD